MKGVRKIGEGRYVGRYFAGYGLRGNRVYPSRIFSTEIEAHEWYLARRADAQINPHAVTDCPPNWVEQKYASIKTSAKRRKIDFNLSVDEYRELLARADGRCMLTGIRFEFQKVNSKSGRRPFAPSLDRVNPNHGYTFDNCRIICAGLNIALCDWGMTDLMRIARALVARETDVMAKERKLVACA